jgi:hypothetical protein
VKDANDVIYLLKINDLRCLSYQPWQKFTLNNFSLLLFKSESSTFSIKPLSRSLIKQLNIPAYLLNIIKDKYTIGNDLAKFITDEFIQLLNLEKIELSPAKLQLFEEAIHTTTISPGDSGNINYQDKIEVLAELNDFKLGTADNLLFNLRKHLSVNCNINDYDSSGLMESDSLSQSLEEIANKQLSKVPENILSFPGYEKSYLQSAYIITNNCFNFLKQVPEINEAIRPHEVTLMLAIICMFLSSADGLGYHINSQQNFAFYRARIFAAIFLAMSLNRLMSTPPSWTVTERKALNFLILRLVYTDACSGELAKELYSEIPSASLNKISKRLKFLFKCRSPL